MAQGNRAETADRINTAHNRSPYALGPILGRMLLAANLSPTTAATLLGVYDQTLYRWLYGMSAISPRQLPKVAKLLMILSWILTKQEPLRGTVQQRERQFTEYIKQMKHLQKP